MRAEPSPATEERAPAGGPGRPDLRADTGAGDLVRFGRAFLAASLVGLAVWTALALLLYRVLA